MCSEYQLAGAFAGGVASAFIFSFFTISIFATGVVKKEKDYPSKWAYAMLDKRGYETFHVSGHMLESEIKSFAEINKAKIVGRVDEWV